jgi:hypothetical protein
VSQLQYLIEHGAPPPLHVLFTKEALQIVDTVSGLDSVGARFPFHSIGHWEGDQELDTMFWACFTFVGVSVLWQIWCLGCGDTSIGLLVAM